MSTTPFMQLYWGDYFSKTRRLTCEQHGAYLQIMGTMWMEGGSLSNDPRVLARLTGCSASRWCQVWPAIAAFFDEKDGRITQARVMSDLEKAREKSIKRAESGSRGGKAKALKDKGAGVAIATDLPCHSSEPEPEREESDANASSVGEPTSLTLNGNEVDTVRQAFDAYNELALEIGLAQARKLDPARRKAIGARLKEYGMDGWREALANVRGSSFLRGANGRTWRADLDFLCSPAKLRKVIEGGFAQDFGEPNDRPPTNAPGARAQQRLDIFAAGSMAVAHRLGLIGEGDGPHPGEEARSVGGGSTAGGSLVRTLPPG